MMQSWKSLMILSTGLGSLGFFLGIGSAFFANFQATGHIALIDGVSVTSSMYYLHAGNGHTLDLDEFCSLDDSICHHSGCQGDENTFCSMRDTSVMIAYFAGAMAVFHAMALMAICMDYTSIFLIPSDRAWIFASRVSWLQAFCATLYSILLMVWGDCIGRLPDLNSEFIFRYLPTHEGLSWSLDYGFFFFIIVAVLQILAAVFSFMGSRKLAETVPSHLREQKNCSEWEWKSHMTLSALTAFLAFFLSFMVLLSDSFVANVQMDSLLGDVTELTATMFSLRAGSNITSIPDFCSRGLADTTCGDSSCEGMEDAFCGLRTTAVALTFLGMIIMIVHCFLALAVCLDVKPLWESHGLCSKQAWVLAFRSSAFMAVAALLAVILLPLWGGLKGALPDMSTYDVVNGTKGEWIYLPNSEGTAWRFSWGYVLAFPVALLASASAVFGGYGAKLMRDTAAPGEGGHEPLAPSSLAGAATPQSRNDNTFQAADVVMNQPKLVSAGRVNEDKYREYTDTTL